MTERLLIVGGLIAAVLLSLAIAGYLAVGGNDLPEFVALVGATSIGALAGIVQQRDEA